VITARLDTTVKSREYANLILLLAFARNAATKDVERIEERCDEPVEARTFHLQPTMSLEQRRQTGVQPHSLTTKPFLTLVKKFLFNTSTVPKHPDHHFMVRSAGRLEQKSE
jgi:DNA helicase-4